MNGEFTSVDITTRHARGFYNNTCDRSLRRDGDRESGAFVADFRLGGTILTFSAFRGEVKVRSNGQRYTVLEDKHPKLFELINNAFHEDLCHLPLSAEFLEFLPSS